MLEACAAPMPPARMLISPKLAAAKQVTNAGKCRKGSTNQSVSVSKSAIARNNVIA